MNERIRAVVVRPGESAVAKDIDGSLTGLQTMVDGYIQAMYPFDDNVAVICNDEGKIIKDVAAQGIMGLLKSLGLMNK